MSKGATRAPLRIQRVHEPSAGAGTGAGGGTIDLQLCGARKVTISSERTAQELRAMAAAYLALDERRVVIRRGGGVIAVITSDVAELRQCMHNGVRFEAELEKVTERGGLAVPVRPLAPR